MGADRIADRLYVGKDDKELYDKLVSEWLLRNKTRKEQFLLAMSVGFKNEIRKLIQKIYDCIFNVFTSFNSSISY